MSLQDLESRIQQTLGIQVSSEWLQACVSYLDQQPSNGSLLDRCIHQLLYTDMRDLVMGNNHPSPMATNLQALVARSKSSSPSNNARIQTPTDFRLLVQLEEAVDVSLSREHRFNPQHFHSMDRNNNNRMPRQRCLKLCLSNGHSSILAQEVSRILNLKPDSPAGMKILLQGLIVIKHGYLQLHCGNATVLGGHVTSLVQTQQAAMERARKEMGVGVDPTVRALVGVEDLLLDEPSDEGNEESGDVVPTANPAQHTTTTSFTAPSVATTTNSLSTTNGRSNTTGTFSNNGSTNTSNNNHYRSHPPSAPPAPTPAPATAPIIQAPNNPYRNIGPFGGARTTNPQQQQQLPPQTSKESKSQNPYARRQGSTPRVSISPRAPNSNPYATKQNTNTNRQVPTTTTTTNTTTISNIMASATSPFPTTTTADTTVRTTPASHSSTAITPASTSSNPRRNPYLKSNNTSNANQGHTLAAESNPGFRTASSMLSGNSRPPPSSSRPSNNVANQDTTSNVQNLTFANLYKLLEAAIQNRQLYETYNSVTFRVAMLQQTNNYLFNVGKNKDFKKKQGDKYVFIMNTTFGAANDTTKLLACKLPSSLIEPLFGITATKLRGLSKSDRLKCDRIAKEGGDKVKAKFFPKYLQYWKARLHPTAEEVFSQPNTFALDNLQRPILILEPDKT